MGKFYVVLIEVIGEQALAKYKRVEGSFRQKKQSMQR